MLKTITYIIGGSLVLLTAIYVFVLWKFKWSKKSNKKQDMDLDKIFNRYDQAIQKSMKYFVDNEYKTTAENIKQEKLDRLKNNFPKVVEVLNDQFTENIKNYLKNR